MTKRKDRARRRAARPNPIISKLAAASACSLVAANASALELGELEVHSSLGHPLRASIAYALGPNEQIYDYCVFLRPRVTSSGIPGVSRAAVTITGTRIFLEGNVAIREPLLNVRVAVDCPYTPHLEREFTLFIDPSQPGENAVADTSPHRRPLRQLSRRQRRP